MSKKNDVKRASVMVALMDIYKSNNIYDYEYLGGYRYWTDNDKISCDNGFNVHYKHFCDYTLIKYPQLSEIYVSKEQIENLNDLRNYNIDDDESFECVCGTKIKQRCIIIKKGFNVCMENLIILGNCCIELFYDGEFKKECIECGARHMCRNAKALCGNCFKESKKKKCIICNEQLEKYTRKKECKKCINEIEQKRINEEWERREKQNKRIEKERKEEMEKRIKEHNEKKYKLNKDWINDFKNTKVLFGKYKDFYLIDLMKDENYYNYLYDLINHDYIYDFSPAVSITNAKNLFTYIKYSQNKLNFLHSYKPDEFYSDSIMDYF